MNETEEASPAAETSPAEPTSSEEPTAAPAQAAAPSFLADLSHPATLSGLQGAFDRQRNTENSFISSKVRPLIHSAAERRYVRVPVYSVPVSAGGADAFPSTPSYVTAPLYPGEDAATAAGRIQQEHERQQRATAIAGGELMLSGAAKTLSFNLSGLATGRYDEQAASQLGDESSIVSGIGSTLGILAPAPINAPAYLFGKLSNVGSAATRALFSKAMGTSFGGGVRSALAAAGGSNVIDVSERPFLTWLGRRFGSAAFNKVRPATFNAAKEALEKAGGSLTGTSINVPPNASKEAMDGVRAAFAALKAEMGSSLALKVTRLAPQVAGNAFAGGALGAGYGLGGARDVRDLQKVPGQALLGATLGAGVPLAVQGALRLAEGGASKLQGIFDTFFGAPAAPGTGGFGGASGVPPGSLISGGPMRLLGAPDELVLPSSRPAPVAGPTTPPVSHVYRAAPKVRLAGAPPALTADITATFEEGRNRLVTTTDPVEADRLTKGLRAVEQLGALTQRGAPFVAQGPAGLAEFAGWQDLSIPGRPPRPPVALWNIPSPTGGMTTLSSTSIEQQGYVLPPEMPTPTEIGGAQQALLRAGLDLLGADHQALSRLVGFDHTGLLYGGALPVPPRDVPMLAEATRWAGAIQREGARAGVDLGKVAATLPPLPAVAVEPISARLKGFADLVKARDPNAPVDPPSNLFPVEPSLMPRPADPTNPSPGWSLPSAHDIDLDLRGSLPSPTLRATDAARAARQQQWVTAHLASFQPFEAGRLVATSPHGLGELDSRVVPVKVDEEGRLLVQVQDPARMDGVIDVDVSAGLRPASLPASAGWKFEPSKLAPVELALDPATESLIVDGDKTAQRSWVQHMIRTTLHDDQTGGLQIADDPSRLLSSFLQSPPEDPAQADAFRRRAESLLDAHRSKAPTAAQARAEVGRTASDWEVARRHGEMAQEYMRIGSMIEAVRSIGLDTAPPVEERFGFQGGTDADEAARHAEALAHASTGGGWSNKAHLFAALTPDEKFAAIELRLKSGRIRGSKNLEALNPLKAKPPKYWGAWRPSPEQARALRNAYAERRQREMANWGTLSLLRSRAAKGAAARSAAEWKPLELEDILKIDPADIPRLAEKEPEVFHETLSSFMGSIDGAIARAGSAEDLEKIEVIRQALRDVGDKTLDDAVSQFETAAANNPKLSWIQSAYLACTQPLRWFRFMAATQQRPMGALGWRKQAPEARSFKSEWDAGRIQRGLFWPLAFGHNAQNEMQLRAFTQFRPLMEATAVSPRLNFAISHALEHRLSEATGELDRPEYTFQVKIRPIGPPTTFKLNEWVPRLKAWYERTITDLEREKVQHLTTERNDLHADALWLASKVQEHELHAAQQIDPSIATWADISTKPDVKKGGRKVTSFLEDLRSRIRKEGSGLPIAPGPPAFIAGSYRDLSRVPYPKLLEWYKATLAAHGQKQAAIDSIASGELRQLGYVTRLNRHLGDSVAADLTYPYHPTSRFLSDHIKNDFIDKQRQGLLPANLGWLEGFLMYAPKAAQTIHLEPAIQRVRRKLMAQGPDGRPEVPEFQRQYAHDWVNSLLGKQPPQSRIFNRMMFEGLEQPLALDDFMRNALGKDPAALVRAAKQGGQIRRRAFDEAQNNYNGLMFITLLGPAQLAAMNTTEYSFLARELSKHPPDMLRATSWLPKALAGAHAQGLREILSTAKHQLLPQSPLWYSDATYKGVTDFLHDLDNPIQAGAAAPVGAAFGRIYKLIQKGWGSWFRATQYPLQSTNYAVDLARLKAAFPREVQPVRTADGKLRHIVPDWMKTVAAQQANDNVGVFTRAHVSPYSIGPAGKFFWPLRRFTFGHIEHLLTAATGALEVVPGFEKKSPWPEAAEPPLPPQVHVPDLPNGGAMDPDDLKDWQRYNAPAAQYGTMYSAGGAKWRHLSQLTLGMGATMAALWYSGTFLFSNDETQDGPLFNMLNPYNVERLFEIPTGWWWRDTTHALTLSAQGAFRDLSSREVFDRDNTIARLLWEVPGGRQFRNQYLAEVRHRQFRAAEAAAGHELPPEAPKAPQPPLAPGETRPGLIEKGIDHLPAPVRDVLLAVAPKHLLDQLPPKVAAALATLGPKTLRRHLNQAIVEALIDDSPDSPLNQKIRELGTAQPAQHPAPPGP